MTKEISGSIDIAASRDKTSSAISDASFAQLWFGHGLRDGVTEPHPEFAIAVIDEENPNEIIYRFTKTGWEGFAEISLKQIRKNLTRVIIEHQEIEGYVHGSDEETAQELGYAWKFKLVCLKRFLERGTVEPGFRPFVTKIPKQIVAAVKTESASADKSDYMEGFLESVKASGMDPIGPPSVLIDADRQSDSFVFARIGKRRSRDAIQVLDFNETGATGTYFHGTRMDFYPVIISLVQWSAAHKIKLLGPMLQELLEKNDRTRVETRKIALLTNHPEPSKVQQISQGWLVFPDNWAKWIRRT